MCNQLNFLVKIVTYRKCLAGGVSGRGRSGCRWCSKGKLLFVFSTCNVDFSLICHDFFLVSTLACGGMNHFRVPVSLSFKASLSANFSFYGNYF